MASFDKGRESLRAEDYRAARREFMEALRTVDEHHACYNRINSYLGLAQVLTSDRNGLLLCRDAASSGEQEADLYLNLACAEWYVNNRRRALEAIDRGRGIDGAHERLNRASALIAARRRSILPFLAREHLLNRVLGRLFRKNRSDLTVRQLLY